MTDFRNIGGLSNRRGNRYEDYFTVYRILYYLESVLFESSEVRIKEQASCPVDDLIIETCKEDHYHQLKANKTITWGADSMKLKSEFTRQKEICKGKERLFKLWLVIADEARARSLTSNMPDEIKDVTEIFLFPYLKRLSELAQLNQLVEYPLKKIRATRFSSLTENQNIIFAIYLAWLDHIPDDDGYCLLSKVIEHIRSNKIGRIYCQWQENSLLWEECKIILNDIIGLQYWTDRGYFEWEYYPTDQGILKDNCFSDNFQRFMQRIVDCRPKNFNEFEDILP